MFKIDVPSAVASMPTPQAAGTPGYFGRGDPGSGVLPTTITADFLNAVMEELSYAITQAGITLSKTNSHQLYAAIQAIAAGVVGSGGGAVPTTRQVLGSGLVTGGGTLAADRTLNVGIASAAEIMAGTRNDVAITPSGLASALGGGLGANGYQKLPSGFIIQWGSMTGPWSEGAFNVTFPTTFPTACAAFLPVGANSSSSNIMDTWLQKVTRWTSGATFVVQWTGNNGTLNQISGLDYIAIGY